MELIDKHYNCFTGINKKNLNITVKLMENISNIYTLGSYFSFKKFSLMTEFRFLHHFSTSFNLSKYLQYLCRYCTAVKSVQPRNTDRTDARQQRHLVS